MGTTLIKAEAKELHKKFLEKLMKMGEKHLNMSRSEWGFKHAIAKALNTQDSTIQRWFNGSFPEASFLTRIYETFHIDPNTLLGITPDPRVTELKQNETFQSKVSLGDKVEKILPKDLLLTDHDFVVVPFFTSEVSAGMPQAANAELFGWTLFRKDILKDRLNVVAIRVSLENGTSMFPMIKPGDMVLVDLDDRDPTTPGIFIIELDGKYTIKYLKCLEDVIFAIPFNPAFQPTGYDITASPLQSDKLKVCGRLIIAITYFISDWAINYPEKGCIVPRRPGLVS